MKCQRRYFHFIVVLTAYTLLLLIARWAFVTQVLAAIDKEPTIDEQFSFNVTRIEYSLPLRFYRSTHTGNMTKTSEHTSETNSEDTNVHEASILGNRTISGVTGRKLKFLERVFTNFLHP